MNINSDFDVRAAVHSDRIPWVPSPMAGVDRRMLDRLGDEVARATSIVRYAPGSSFSSHVHTGGEEYLVLDGVFQDEHGDFPIGSYVRNPPLSSHTPSAADGATIFVKLWQFHPDDRTLVNINTTTTEPTKSEGRPGVSVIPLYKDPYEDVRMEIWDASKEIPIKDHNGLEILVIEGGFVEDSEEFSKHSWLRLAPGMDLHATSGINGARVWVKSGHLSKPQTAPAP